MYAIVSLLDREENAQVIEYWKYLENACGLLGVKTTPIPHFSWMVAQFIDLELIRPPLEQIKTISSCFNTTLDGLGLFTGLRPIVYLPVIKTYEMANFHQSLFTALTPCCVSVSSLYSPELWLPHVTLAYGDVNAGKAACAIKQLIPLDKEIALKITNISIIYHQDNSVGIKERFDFKN